MSVSDPPYFHGTSESHAESLVQNGVNMGCVQSRDHGFFGDGFYMTADKDTAMNHATTVGPNTPTIVAIDFSGASILHAGETFGDGPSVVPTAPPSWHEDYLDWELGKVESAAVWEYATDRSKEDIMGSAREERTPGAASFDRERWYKSVTEYADARGYDIVYWHDGEIILKNPSAVSNITRVR